MANGKLPYDAAARHRMPRWWPSCPCPCWRAGPGTDKGRETAARRDLAGAGQVQGARREDAGRGANLLPAAQERQPRSTESRLRPTAQSCRPATTTMPK
jgi:hypothetical protein